MGSLFPQSVISSSQQSLDLAPHLAPVSPTAAIKSMLIPRCSITQRGRVSQSTQTGPCTNAQPGFRCDEVEHTHRKQQAPPTRPLHDPWCGTRYKFSVGVHAQLAGRFQHYLLTTAVTVRTMSTIPIQNTPHVSTAVWTTVEVQNSCSIWTRGPSSNSCALLFQRVLSAGEETQWWKPQETRELYERLQRGVLQHFGPVLHHTDRQEHRFLWMTTWHSSGLLIPSAPSNTRSSQFEKSWLKIKGCNICYEHAYGDACAQTNHIPSQLLKAFLWSCF